MVHVHLDMRAARDVEPDLFPHLLLDDRPDVLVEATGDEFRVGHAAETHIDRRSTRVVGDQGPAIHGIVQRAKTQDTEFGGFGGHLLDEGLDHDPIELRLVAERGYIQEAAHGTHAVQARHPLGDPLDGREAGRREHLCTLDGDHVDLVIPEIEHGPAIQFLRRITRREERLRRGIDLQIDPHRVGLEQGNHSSEGNPEEQREHHEGMAHDPAGPPETPPRGRQPSPQGRSR